MRIVVLGGGVIGIANAYYLAESGCEVVVADRQSGPGLETSFANAGMISPGYAGPLAAPGVPLKALKWMLRKHSPVVIRPRLDPAQWRWLAAMLRYCTAAHYRVNKERMFRLADYSRACLEALRQQTGIVYDERTRGTLQLFRDQQGADGAAKDRAILEDWGVPHELLDREGCLKTEPALRRVREKVVGGLRFPGDETGDCFKFTQALAEAAARYGVSFHWNTPVTRLVREGDRISQVETDRGPLKADVYVMAMGSYAPLLLRPLGIRIPVYPMKGYSATVPIVDEEAAPVSTLVDDRYKVAVTRLGGRIRAAGTVEFAGYDLDLSPSSCATILHVVKDLFPQGGDLDQADYWTGLRPATPDGPPVIGPTRYANLFLNAGHGTLGWTMACGSGKVVADLVNGRKPDIDTVGLTIDRYPNAQ